MLTLDATALARVAAGHRGVAWLVEMDFQGGTVRYTTWPDTVDTGSTGTVSYSSGTVSYGAGTVTYASATGGSVYTALGTLADIQNVQESADTATDQITLSLSVTNNAIFAAAMGNATTYRARQARLYLQLFDDKHQPAGAAVQRWQGYMSKLQITRKAATDGDSSSGRIEMLCARAGMARVRNAQGLRLTDAQQQSRFPGDTGLRYVRTLLEQPALWLSKKFQQV